MASLCEKYGKGKVFLVLVFSLTALVAVIAVISYIFHIHVTYRGHRFRLSDMDSDRVVLVAPDGSELVAERSERGTFGERYVAIYVFDEVIRHELGLVDDDDSSLATVFGDRAWVFTFPDGREVITEWFGNHLRPATSLDGTDEWELYQTLSNRYLGREDARWWFIVVPLGSSVFFALGAWRVVAPRSIWEIEHVFTVKNGEPTDFALSMHILFGYVIIIGTFITSLIILRIIRS